MKNIYFAAQSENLGLKKVSFKAPQTTKMRNAQNRSKDLCTPLSSALDSVYDLLASVSRHCWFMRLTYSNRSLHCFLFALHVFCLTSTMCLLAALLKGGTDLQNVLKQGEISLFSLWRWPFFSVSAAFPSNFHVWCLLTSFSSLMLIHLGNYFEQKARRDSTKVATRPCANAWGWAASSTFFPAKRYPCF